MKTVHVLFRLPFGGGSEVVGIYSTRQKAERLLEQLRENRRRGFCIKTLVVDGVPAEDFWFDTARERELRSDRKDPLTLLLDRVKDTVDQWVRDFDRASRRAPRRRKLRSRRART